ncbi:MAG TPA: histidine kinase [Holophagaceae bacterium]|nr:histidine kinase [Holophagaceae bacterium]
MLAPDLGKELRTRLRSPLTWGIVIAFWLIFSFATMVGIRSLSSKPPTAFAAVEIFVTLVVCLDYAFLTPLPWRWTGDARLRAPLLRGALQAIVFNLACILVCTALEYYLWRAAGSPVIRVGEVIRSGSFAERLGPQLLIGTPMMMIVGLLLAVGQVGSAEKAAAEAELREAQWVLLRGQLSPHVLFNALNGLAELVHLDPHQAEQAILDLSALYRALLEHGDRPWAPLSEERALVERYLRLEALRLGSRLAVRWEWAPELDAVETPPFLVQPLVENALKHGIAKAEEGGVVEVHLARVDGRIRIQVANTGRPTPLVLGSGIGLRNLEARLKLAYGDRAAFRLYPDGPWTVAEILLPETP